VIARFFPAWIGLLTCTVSLAAQTPSLTITDSHIAERIAKLEDESPRFHQAMESIRHNSLSVTIGTRQQMSVVAPWAGLMLNKQRLAETAARFDTVTGAVQLIAVQIDLQRIARQASRPAQFNKLIDLVLIHEVWGHVVPMAASGLIAAFCADPVTGQKAMDSCVMQRENDLRAELGLAQRSTYRVASAW
jgi:hypothetical protein